MGAHTFVSFAFNRKYIKHVKSLNIWVLYQNSSAQPFRGHVAPTNESQVKFSNLTLRHKIWGCRCLVAEPDKVLVGELNQWVANPLGPGQTSALQIKSRSA